ncbi:MAG: lysophospholipase [Caldilineaceae bacterium]|nr:lysophospholipase [Caldilineaceae bacterium]MCB0094776.1 lysophospholipase [Caldilineaceae bacterium]MCB0141324.1 lysophospholipase [Caldilineaceae bacterium]
MHHSTNLFAGYNELSLFCQNWRPDTTPKGVFVLVPGLGEHSDRYTQLVPSLVEHGYWVYSYDTRGHGRSAGKRGHIDSWSDYRQDLGCFLDYVRQKTGFPKPFLYGHSLGGLMVLDYVLHDESGLRGVIASAPAVDATAQPAAFITLLKGLNKVAPSLQLTSPLKTGGLSRVDGVEEAYRTDPLVHHKVTPRFAVESLRAIDWVQAHAGRLTLPILMLHGEEDTIVDIQGTRRFFAHLTAADKTLVTYPGGRHESHNDIQHAEVAEQIVDWLEAHLPQYA